MGRDVIIACDFDSKEQTLDFLDKLGDHKPYVKIGMELYYAEGPSIVKALKERGYNLYGLTNWSGKVYGVMRKYDIFSLLDGWVISSEEHLIKPDVAIYRRLGEKFNLLPEECLFTDDKQVNIDGAVRAGMQAVLFTDAHTLAEYMKQNAIL